MMRRDVHGAQKEGVIQLEAGEPPRWMSRDETDGPRFYGWVRHPVWVLVIAAALLAVLVPALSSVEASTPTPHEVEAIARTLYCPLCVGQRLDSCEIPLCVDMKREIAEQLSEGRTADEIRAYFVEQYGPVVLGEPPRRGVNWLAWVLPFVILLGVGAFVALRLRTWTQTAEVTVPARPPSSGSEDAKDAAEDAYESRVDQDLSNWE